MTNRQKRTAGIWLQKIAFVLLIGFLFRSTPVIGQNAPDLTDYPGMMSRMLEELLAAADYGSDDTTYLDAVGNSGDPLYIAPLIDLAYFGRTDRYLAITQAIFTALQRLSDQDFGFDWRAYMEWASRSSIGLPPDYDVFKGQLLSTLIDPQFERFFQPGVMDTAKINLVEVVWGGVRVDGIPSLVNARQITPQEAAAEGTHFSEFCRGDDCRYPAPDELVFGVSINGDDRAYPLRILNWHEMFNDVVGGQPVMLAYCTLCGAGVLYDPVIENLVVDGENLGRVALEFGSTGMLMRSNKLMYDRTTVTVWNALTGRPAFGKLADSDIRLSRLPVVVSDWATWLAEHPDTTVLSLDTGHIRNYTNGAAYSAYFNDPNYLMFPVWQQDLSEQDVKDVIFALDINDTPKAYPLRLLIPEAVTNDTLAGQNLVILSRQTPERAFFEPGGATVRAYARGEHVFSPGAHHLQVIDENGVAWDATEDALVSADGESLERLPGHLAFWFGWYGFYPETLVYEPE